MYIHLLTLEHWPNQEYFRSIAQRLNDVADILDACGISDNVTIEVDKRDTTYYLSVNEEQIPIVLQTLLTGEFNKMLDIEPSEGFENFLCYPFKERWGRNMYLYAQDGKEYTPENDPHREKYLEEIRRWKSPVLEAIYGVEEPLEDVTLYNRNENIDQAESGGP